MKEISEQSENDITKETHQRIIEVVKSLVGMMSEATDIVEFFSKQDEIKRVRKNIKRTVLAESFGTPELVQAITDQFMELAKVKFK